MLAVDLDPQASLTISLGHPQPDQLPVTISDMMGKVLTDQPITPGEGILHHPEGFDLMPSDIQLSGMEVFLVNAMSRETILRQCLDTVRKQYTHILLDCQPSLGMLTVNALAAANRIVIPVSAEYLPAKGLEQLLQTVAKVRRQINPKLQIDGILLAMVDNRTNFAKEIAGLIRDTYGSKINVFSSEILLGELFPFPDHPFSVRDDDTINVVIGQGGDTQTIEKYDSVSHEALSGVTFQLRWLGGASGTGGTVIGQKKTGSNGMCMWTGLNPGVYIVEEVDPGDGYTILQSSETIFLADSGEQSVVTVRFENVPDGSLLIRKVCAANPSITLQNAEFKVTYSDGTLIGDSARFVPLIHGAAARSSDEAPVMGAERRGIVNADLYVNRKSKKP